MNHIIKKCIQTVSKSKLFKYALVTNTAFGMLLRSVGDVIQQRIEYKYQIKQVKTKNEFKLDWVRTENVSLTGLAIGPFSYYWYKYLDKIFPAKTFKIVCKKILLDQIVAATVFTFLFIFIICLLKGFSIQDSLNEFNSKFLYIYLVDWLIWPPSQAINFLFIPQQYRVAFVNLILVCWNVFLSSCYPEK